MNKSFARWLWGPTYAGAAEPISVWRPEHGGTHQEDLVELTRRTLLQIGQLEDRLKQVVPAPGVPGSDRELKQFAKSLLPTLDSLDRLAEFAAKAVEKQPELENWLTSIQALRSKTLRTLEGIGLTPVATVGCPVDLNIHDVVKTVRAPGIPPDTVVEENQKGYYFRGKLLRDAKVVVSQ